MSDMSAEGNTSDAVNVDIPIPAANTAWLKAQEAMAAANVGPVAGSETTMAGGYNVPPPSINQQTMHMSAANPSAMFTSSASQPPPPSLAACRPQYSRNNERMSSESSEAMTSPTRTSKYERMLGLGGARLAHHTEEGTSPATKFAPQHGGIQFRLSTPAGPARPTLHAPPVANTNYNNVPPPTMAAAAAHRAQGPSTDMPPGMQAYVERAYIAADNDAAKSKVDQALKTKLQPLLRSGMAWKVDWATELLPTDAGYMMMRAGGTWTPAVDVRLSSQQRLQHALANVKQACADNRGGIRGRIGARGGANTASNANTAPLGMRRRLGGSIIRSRSRSTERQSGTSSRQSGGHTRRVVGDRSSPGDESDGSGGLPTHKGDMLQSRLGKKAKKKNGQPAPAKKAKLASQFSVKETTATAKLRASRAARFTDTAASRRRQNHIQYEHMYDVDRNGDDGGIDLTKFHITGTSRELEKRYLRLTTAPNAADVRPPVIIRQSLTFVKAKFRQNQDNYHYACNQLKSMRQDLVVQGIRDELTVEVYETHARIALEKGDRNEFNQCQTQLAPLHTQLKSPSRFEFIAYRILYNIALDNSAEVLALLDSVHRDPVTRADAEKDECLTYALAIRRAWNTDNFTRLFRMYGDDERAPRMSNYVLDWCIARQRRRYIITMCKAYRPTLSVAHVQTALKFESRASTLEWLNALPVPFTSRAQTDVECKDVKLDE